MRSTTNSCKTHQRFEGALSSVLSKLSGRSLVAMEVAPTLEGIIPCFFEETGGFLCGGDLFLSFIVARSVCKRLSLRYAQLSEIEGFVCFQIQTVPHMDASALCVIHTDLLEVLSEYVKTEQRLIIPIYGLLWVSRKKLLLQVNSGEFYSIYFDEGAMRVEEKIPEGDVSKIRLDVCLGGIELTPEEYFSLRPGFTLKVTDSEFIPLSLKTLGIEIGKGKLTCSADGISITVDTLKKVPCLENDLRNLV